MKLAHLLISKPTVGFWGPLVYPVIGVDQIDTLILRNPLKSLSFILVFFLH